MANFKFNSTKIILNFFTQRYNGNKVNDTIAYKGLKEDYLKNKKIYDEALLNSSETSHVTKLDELKKEIPNLESWLKETDEELKALEVSIQNVAELNNHLWTLTNTLFVVGGMVGAFTSKYVAEFLGRKKGILFHYIFVVVGSVLVIVAPYVNSPECVIVSRFLFGVQGGMCCGLIPTYLSEISPVALRGATGVMHQLCVTIGILVAQLLGFRQLMGVESLWHFLLGLPIIPAVLGGLVLMIFFSETPRALLTTNKDEDAARDGNYFVVLN